MNLRTALARVFGMAAILAVLAFASSAAEAHGGHVHTGAAPVVLALQAPAATVSLDSLSVRLVLDDTAQHDHGVAELRASPDIVPADSVAICQQGCCAGAPCHSSTACTLGADVVVMLPRDAGMSVVAGNAPGIAGHDPEGLRKPPRTFA